MENGREFIYNDVCIVTRTPMQEQKRQIERPSKRWVDDIWNTAAPL